MMIDLSYAYQAINDAALKAINKRREELLGRQYREILSDVSEWELHKQKLDRAFCGQVVKYRAWMDFPIIGRRYMDIVYTPYAQTDHSIAGCVVNSRDITERYELELKLENAQKMEFMGTIAGGVAHDLNNILSGIVSYPDIGDSFAGATAFLEGDYVLLEIADTGMGISKEDRQRIFEPFYTKKVMGRSGTGLGLAVVWGTVMDHYGHIEVDSDGKNGSVFRLYFPVSHEKAELISQIKDIHKYKGNGDTILIVDDIEEQRLIASDILSELEYTVTTVPSGEDAIAFLQKHSVDLVILDMLMPPGMDGLDTYQEILKINPDQKAIIASGFAETDRVKEAMDLGIGQYIKKPYTISEVGAAVKTILAT